MHKSPYSGQPSDWVRQLIKKLAAFPAVIVVRSVNEIASVNLLGHVYLGEDAGEFVLRVRESDDHIHIAWDKISRYSMTEEDTPGGLEPVVGLFGSETLEPVIRLFFPDQTPQDLKDLGV